MAFKYLWIAYALSALLIPIVITKKQKPTVAIAWLLTVIFLPILGPVLFFTFGTDRIVNSGRKKLFANQTLRDHLRQVEAEWDPMKVSGTEDTLSENQQNLVRISRKFSLFDAVAENKVEILIDAEQAYEAMEQAMRSAEKHINLEYYIFEPDSVGQRFQDVLIEKARQGVEVKLLYDAVGSWRLGWSRNFLESLRDAGVEVVDFLPLRTFFKPWNLNLRNHRKILVVDSKVGFTGSLNVGAEFMSKNYPSGKNWRETHLMIKGPAVAQLQWIFCEDWYFATQQELLTSKYFELVESAGSERVQVVASGPDVREAAIHKIFLTAISQAEKSVYLTTPYFIPDQAFNLALQIAALRGVDVRILVPSKSDHRLVLYAGQSYYDELLQNGVRIFEYAAGHLHSKMLVVDGCFTVIGSANVDMRSFGYNFELNVHAYEEALASKAEEIFFSDLGNSRELERSAFSKRPAPRRFRENLCRLFSPLL